MRSAPGSRPDPGATPEQPRAGIWDCRCGIDINACIYPKCRKQAKPEPERIYVPIPIAVPSAPVVVPTQPKPVQPIIIVHPVSPVVPKLEPENEPETIPESGSKQFGKNSPKNSERIRIPNSLDPTEDAPQAAIAPYKKKGKVGRQRKYEDAGNNSEIPVKEVVLFRHVKGRHWPGMSQDMREWYDFYYFKRPVRTERAKDAEDYTRHVKAWERRERWIAEYEASQGRYYQSQAVGNSGKIVAYRKRANS